MEKMKCPNCDGKLKKVMVDVGDAKTKAVSYQCTNCDYFTFEPKSAVEIIREIKEHESALKIKQNLIYLSKDRLGLYLGKDIVRSLNLKAGEEVLVTERGRPVARLTPTIAAHALPQHLAEMEKQGLIKAGTGKLPKDFWDLPRPKDPKGLTVKSVIREREEGW